MHKAYINIPKPGLEYILDFGASDLGFGAVLSKYKIERTRDSLCFKADEYPAQRERHIVTRNKLLVTVAFLTLYFLDQRFRLRTDYGSLGRVFKGKVSS